MDSNPDTMDLIRISSCHVVDGAGRRDVGFVAIIVVACHMASKKIISSSCQRAVAKQSHLGFNVGLDGWVRQALGAVLVSQLVGNLFVPPEDRFRLAFAYELMSAPSARTRR